MNSLQSLNKNQLEAVLQTEGPVMVMAGAGSGKTRVLTNRICYLINEIGVSPYEILAVTFTNKAANEMKERINKILDVDTRFMWVSTFHSFCARFLRLEADYLKDRTKNFQILDTDDTLKIINSLIKDNDFFEDVKARDLQRIISIHKNRPNTVFSDRISDYFNVIYPLYERELERLNALDFDDLILKTLSLLKDNLVLRIKYQTKFQYLLIDEFQDTNDYQYELVHILADKHKNIFIVGDQDQSIYSFRGANVKNINKFIHDYKNDNLKQIILEENYRSTKEILDVANSLISHNDDRIKKNLYSSISKKNSVNYKKCASSYEETVYVIEKILEYKSNGIDLKDMAILYRNSYISRNFEDYLVRMNVPYVIYGGLSFYSRKEVKDMIAYIRLVYDHTSDLSFERIINEPKRAIGPLTVDKLKQIAEEHNISLFEAIDYIEGSAKNKLLNFKKMIENLTNYLSTNLSFEDFFNKVFEESNYKDYLERNNEEDRIENIKELLTVFKESEEKYEGTKIEILGQFLNDLALRTDADNEDSSDVLKLMTIHQAKGLEFDVVFVVALEDGIFPRDVFDDLEEERRICYVAVTRAKQRLHLTSADSRFIFGKILYNQQSKFLKEMGFNKSTKIKPINKIEDEPKEEKIYYLDDYNIGDHIEHKIFGKGIIVNIYDNKLEIAFSHPIGVKTLQKNHASITKIDK